MSEADDRLRDAKSKAILIGRILGEGASLTHGNNDGQASTRSVKSTEMEDFGRRGDHTDYAGSSSL